MPLKVIAKDGSEHFVHSPQDYERIFHVRFLSGLQYCDVKTQNKIEKQHRRAIDREWISPKQKWLGHYFAEGIRGKIPLDLTIAWIDEAVGYGVWTNRPIAANMFIGEYAGLLRKRKFWGRWKNLYCFDYNIGAGKSSSFVIDAQDFGNHARFINHSFQPNLEPVSVYCDGMVHVVLSTKHAIEPGTQLCYDYGEDYWEKRSKPKSLAALPKE